MTDTLKERDFLDCDCPMGKYSLHCTEEQKNQILQNQRISFVVSGIAKEDNLPVYGLITKYETLKEKEKQFTENQKIVDRLKSAKRITEQKIAEQRTLSSSCEIVPLSILNEQLKNILGENQ